MNRTKSRMRRLFPLAGVAGFAALVACTPVKVFDTVIHPVGVADDQMALSAHNEKALDVRWGYEARLAGRPSTRPARCLALSGGGIRSAAVAMGALAALAETGQLGQYEIISGTSGGAYALSWLYANLLGQFERNDAQGAPGRPLDLKAPFAIAAADRRNEDPVENRGRADAAAGTDAAVARRAQLAGVADWPLAVFDATVASPFNLLLNGLFRLHVNTSVAKQAAYASTLRRTFHDDRRVAIDRFKRMFEHRATGWRPPPYFVITATAAIEDDLSHHGSSAANTVFEFTPRDYGSDGFGYGDHAQHGLALDDVVAISGAAIDLSTMTPGAVRRIYASVLNTDLGRYVVNPNPESAARWTHGLVPVGNVWLRGTQRDKDGAKIYLTDGGHADNLAVYPLIRRLCKRIDIVDAEHDPDYRFGAYFSLKSILRRDMNVRLDVPAIDATRQEYVQLNDPRITRERFVKPTQPTCGPFVAKGELATGRVASFPVPRRIEPSGRGAIEIRYLKMSISAPSRHSGPLPGEMDCAKVSASNDFHNQFDEARLAARYGRFVAKRALEMRHGDCTGTLLGLPGKCSFPQEPTTDQWFSYDQFRAYNDLGYWLAKGRL